MVHIGYSIKKTDQMIIIMSEGLGKEVNIQKKGEEKEGQNDLVTLCLRGWEGRGELTLYVALLRLTERPLGVRVHLNLRKAWRGWLLVVLEAIMSLTSSWSQG